MMRFFPHQAKERGGGDGGSSVLTFTEQHSVKTVDAGIVEDQDPSKARLKEKASFYLRICSVVSFI